MDNLFDCVMNFWAVKFTPKEKLLDIARAARNVLSQLCELKSGMFNDS